MNPSQLIYLLGILVFVGIAAFLIFGLPLLRKFGTRAGGLFYPGDDGRPVRPEYSVAEARAQVGDYVAAVAEYRKVIAQHPADVYAHVQIAQLAADHLDDLATAEVELLTACRKAVTVDTAMLAQNRLADLYQFKLHYPNRALEVMEELCAKFPGTPVAERAAERCAALQKILAGNLPVKPPAKIAFRKIGDRKQSP